MDSNKVNEIRKAFQSLAKYNAKDLREFLINSSGTYFRSDKILEGYDFITKCFNVALKENTLLFYPSAFREIDKSDVVEINNQVTTFVYNVQKEIGQEAEKSLANIFSYCYQSGLSQLPMLGEVEILKVTSAKNNELSVIIDSAKGTMNRYEDEFKILKSTATKIQDSASETLNEIIDKHKSFSLEERKIKESISDLQKTLIKLNSEIKNNNDFVVGTGERFKILIEKYETLKNSLEAQEEEIKISKQSIIYSQEEMEKIIKSAASLDRELQELLSPAIAKNLSLTFKERKNSLIKRKNRFLWLLFISAILFTYYVYLAVIKSFKVEELSSIVLIACFSRLIFPFTVLLFLLREYVKERDLEEEYAFREAVSDSMIFYAEQVKESPEKKERLIYNTVNRLYQSPSQKKVNKAGKALEKSLKNLNMPDFIKNLKELVETLKK